MDKFIKGRVYRLNSESDDKGLFQDGYLWIYTHYDHPTDCYFFKSIATGRIDWWPPLWMKAADV
jgi:hypothetical protein